MHTRISVSRTLAVLQADKTDVRNSRTAHHLIYATEEASEVEQITESNEFTERYNKGNKVKMVIYRNCTNSSAIYRVKTC